MLVSTLRAEGPATDKAGCQLGLHDMHLHTCSMAAFRYISYHSHSVSADQAVAALGGFSSEEDEEDDEPPIAEFFLFRYGDTAVDYLLQPPPTVSTR
ncbi:hypothetical protein TGAM01_v205435 [Trichoderma gamsii]|uniref:Uncharacterized protein n=1 Tax=Trichoderma gamsii TaxID=398673 RepID=A0A2P4ZMM6_9HYPO|nr:hypothetical protein TGAM01_v205435 [Trichoderma gamsii]PON25550.1 hypothetical protein TGAM01_v205435 [Trichoderma gamsii]